MRNFRNNTLVAVSSVFLVLTMSACGGGGGSLGGDGGAAGAASGGTTGTPSGGPSSLTYDVNVRRSTFGIPHIQADDFGSLGYGMGYAYGEDNVCTLMEDIVAIRGEHARYFGRNGSYTIFANGSTADSVDSDFFWRHVLTDEEIQKFKDDASEDVNAVLEGYAAGFSRYVREIKSGEHAGRHPLCRNADWLFEISVDDMYRRVIRLAVLASSSVFVEGVANAQPPVGGAGQTASSMTAGPAQQLSPDPAAQAAAMKFLSGDRELGSNMYGFSDQVTANGRPYLFGNPHFPWFGPERLWLMQLIHPELGRIMGVSLHGAPAVLIGFNDHFAWSHTVSAAFRFTFYELNMVGPTSYQFDAGTRELEATNITIDVLEDNGQIAQQSRTLYKSHYGPMVTIVADALDWGATKAYTLRDANLENTAVIEQFFQWNKAQSIDEFKAAQRNVLGVPWVNTVAVGNTGDAYYADITVVPNVPNSKVATCAAEPANSVVQNLAAAGLPVLNGSLSNCAWDTDVDAPRPGVFGPANLPFQERNDYVTNCNDSYWLTNPAQPITGFADIIGDEETARSLRTRLCITQAEELVALPDDQFTLERLQEVVLDSRTFTSETEMDEVQTGLCNAPGGVIVIAAGEGQGTPVAIGPACTVLANWDGKNNLNSVGGHIWREFWRQLGAANLPIFSTAFDAGNPVTTPANLNTLSSEVRDAFARAILRLNNNSVSLNATMGELQYDLDSDGTSRIPTFGGGGGTGSFTIIRGQLNTPTAAEGYGRNTFGNSYIQTVTWDDDGPIAEGFLTYSQSLDPTSPHFSDMTKRYSDKNWIRWPYTESQVEAEKISEMQLQE